MNNLKIKEKKITIDGIEFNYLCPSSEILEKKGRKFLTNGNEEIAIFRVKGKIYAISNICIHKHEPQMYNGFVYGENVICPMHGWRYSLKTGKKIDGSQKLQTYKLLETEDKIYIEKLIINAPKWMLEEYQENNGEQ